MTSSLSSQPKLGQGHGHGLFVDWPPPSREVLGRWLAARGVIVADGLEVCEMDGQGDSHEKGWRVLARRNLGEHELLCAIPKTAILSSRSSSLPPLLPTNKRIGNTTSHTILHLASCLLHELRLGVDSPFFGYLQALPRDTRAIGLPFAWRIEEVAGKDGELARKWLEGTEAERDMRRKANEGLGLEDLRQFYLVTGSHLPATRSHSLPSPFLAFLHAFSLVSTRAFLVDLYHTVALCPFADIFNHSSHPHTSLASDDFVCHRCGSLKTCPHDVLNSDGISMRLAHLSDTDRRRVECEKDTVEMRAERGVEEGEEVWNCYGEELGDARLLVEWGFISEEFAGDGLTWDMKELCGVGSSSLKGQDEDTIGPDSPLSRVLQAVAEMTIDMDNDEESLLSPARWTNGRPILALDQSARISVLMFAAVHVAVVKAPLTSDSDVETVSEAIVRAIDQVTETWRRVEVSEETDVSLDSSVTGDNGNRYIALAEAATKSVPSASTISTAKMVRQVLLRRSAEMHRPETLVEELFDVKDTLRPGDHFQRMALTLSINERQLLVSSMAKWHQWLQYHGEA